MSNEIPDTTLDHADETLLAYLDGELGDEERTRFEATLEGSPEMQAELARMEQLGELMRKAAPALEAAIAATGEKGAPDALFARIESGLAAEAEGATPAPAPATDAAPPALRVIRGGGRRRVVGGFIAVAAAAAVALVASKGLAPNGPTGGDGTPPGDPPPAVATLGSEVVEVDFGKSTGTIFNVEGEHGQPLAVVWIDDPEDLYGPLPVEGMDKEDEEVTQ